MSLWQRHEIQEVLWTLNGEQGKGILMVRVAIAMYSKEQWKSLLEVAADRDELETTSEEW